MTRSILLSLVFHSAMIIITAISLPFMMRTPIDLPPILSVDLIQITDTTSIPFAAKASKLYPYPSSSSFFIKSESDSPGKPTITSTPMHVSPSNFFI